MQWIDPKTVPCTTKVLRSMAECSKSFETTSPMVVEGRNGFPLMSCMKYFLQWYPWVFFCQRFRPCSGQQTSKEGSRPNSSSPCKSSSTCYESQANDVKENVEVSKKDIIHHVESTPLTRLVVSKVAVGAAEGQTANVGVTILVSQQATWRLASWSLDRHVCLITFWRKML